MKCTGKLCPENFKALNTPGFVSRVVLLPYLYRDGDVQILVDDGFSFFDYQCLENQTPFTCVEKKFEIPDISIKSDKITHIIITGTNSPLTMYIFVKISSKEKNLYLLNYSSIYSKRMEIRDAYADIKRIFEEIATGTNIRRVKLRAGVYEGLRYQKMDAKKIGEVVHLGDMIGKGTYGSVFKGTLLQDIVIPDGSTVKSGTTVAVKVQELKGSKLIERELYSLYKAMEEKCPNLIQIYDVLYDFNTKQYYIIMEYVEGSDIYKLVKTKDADFQEYLKDEKKFVDIILFPLIKAVDCLHKHNIAHRDIKGGNILLDEKNKRIVLIDLGLSCFIPKCSGRTGTIATMYPLYFLQTGFEKVDRRTADLWSIGATIYQIFNNYKVYPLITTLNYFRVEKLEDMIKKTIGDWKGRIEYGNIPENFKTVREIFKGFITLPLSF